MYLFLSGVMESLIHLRHRLSNAHKKEAKKESSDITLVLPYPIADIEYYEKYYDSIIIPECLHGSHPKSAITLKNRWMIEQSNLVIVYVERNIGGAYNAMKYAEKLNKKNCQPL